MKVWTIERWDGGYECFGVEATEMLAWEVIARWANEEYDTIRCNLDRPRVVFAGRTDARAVGWRDEIAARRVKDAVNDARVVEWEVAL